MSLKEKYKDNSNLLIPYISTNRNLFIDNTIREVKVKHYGNRYLISVSYGIDKNAKYLFKQLKLEKNLFRINIIDDIIECEFIINKHIDYIMDFIKLCGIENISSDTAMRNALFWGDYLKLFV